MDEVFGRSKSSSFLLGLGLPSHLNLITFSWQQKAFLNTCVFSSYTMCSNQSCNKLRFMSCF